ncbi:MAG: CHAT domain-containing protein, partial [Halothece sp.]
MGKLAVLSLGDGDFKRGFQKVTLQLWEDNHRFPTKFVGKLAPSSKLPRLYELWQSNYRGLCFPNRLEAKSGQITNVSIDDVYRSSQALNKEINLWLNSEPFRPIRDELLKKLNQSEEIQLIIETEDHQLRRLPWHLWDFFSFYPKAQVAISTSIYERITSISKSNPKVRILAILGDSNGIDIQADRRLLENLPNAETKFLVEPSRRELDEWFWSDKGWDILFFAGHSSSQTNTKTGIIYLNKIENLTINQLKNALNKAILRGLKIAIFNSCDGLGIASELAELHIPQVIVMREPVPDLVAQEFLKYFLKAFSRGESLYLAVREAQERLQFLENKFPCATWLPVICQNPSELQVTWQDLCQVKVEEDMLNLEQELYVANTNEQLQSLNQFNFFGEDNIIDGQNDFPVECMINKSKLRIEYCDITQLTVDVMVSSDDIYLSMGGGVSRSILRAGGQSIWEEAQARTPVQLGDIAITTAGKIKAKQIFHAAVLD